MEEDADVFSSDHDANGHELIGADLSTVAKRKGKGLFEDSSGKERPGAGEKQPRTPRKGLRPSASNGNLGGDVVVTNEEDSLQLSNKEV